MASKNNGACSELFIFNLTSIFLLWKNVWQEFSSQLQIGFTLFCIICAVNHARVNHAVWTNFEHVLANMQFYSVHSGLRWQSAALPNG
jgi:hypothetical protein